MKNDRGFMIMEAVIATAIMLASMLAMLTLYSSLTRGLRAQSQVIEFNQLTESINGVIASSTTCTPTLAGQPFNATPGTMTTVIYNDPSGPFTAGTVVGNLKITNVKLEYIATIAFNTYLANLWFIADKTGDITGPRGMHRSLRLQLTTNLGLVTSCYVYSNLSLADVCTSLLGVFDPVTQTCGAIP